MVYDLLVLVLDSNGDIKIDDFYAKVSVDEEVVELDVPMGDTELVKIRDALDEIIANLRDIVLNFVAVYIMKPESSQFRENHPRRRSCLERIDQRDNVLGLWLESIQKLEYLELVRFLGKVQLLRVLLLRN